MNKESNKKSMRFLRCCFLLLALACSVGFWVYIEYSHFPPDRPATVISNLTSHSVTIMSILVASGAILMSIASTRLIKNLVKTGHYHRLVESLLVSIVLFLVAAMLGLISMYLPMERERLFFCLVSAAFASGVANFADTGWKLYMVLNSLHPRPQRS